MKERPILFSTPMVQAILEGRKTQTRRIKYKCDVGDILWVRESFIPFGKDIDTGKHVIWCYKADGGRPCDERGVGRWHPSIHMPRAACRLFLRVRAVRVERLQDITASDCIEEGILENFYKTPAAANVRLKADFAKLWNSLNAKRGYSWESNPLVKVIEFERIQNYGGFYELV
jgi:hypothetical protein